MHSNRGKPLKCHLKGKSRKKLANGQKIEKKRTEGFICPFNLAIHVYHNIQTCLLVYIADLR